MRQSVKPGSKTCASIHAPYVCTELTLVVIHLGVQQVKSLVVYPSPYLLIPLPLPLLHPTYTIPPIPTSRRQPSRVPWKERRLPDIIQTQEILHDAIQAQPAPAMRTTTPLESFRIMPEALIERRDTLQPHAVAEVVVVVDTLGAGHDFLPAHEEVVGVCEGRVERGRVGVEGAEGAGEEVDGVEVCVVLFRDDLAECFLLGGAKARVSRISVTVSGVEGDRMGAWEHDR